MAVFRSHNKSVRPASKLKGKTYWKSHNPTSPGKPAAPSGRPIATYNRMAPKYRTQSMTKSQRRKAAAKHYWANLGKAEAKHKKDMAEKKKRKTAMLNVSPSESPAKHMAKAIRKRSKSRTRYTKTTPDPEKPGLIHHGARKGADMVHKLKKRSRE